VSPPSDGRCRFCIDVCVWQRKLIVGACFQRATTLPWGQAGLGKALRQQRGGGSGGEESLENIIVPTDEFQYWADAATAGTELLVRERASFFNEEFQPLTTDFGNMISLSLLEMLELLERTQDALDDVWKQVQFEPVFPLPRMKRLLEVMGTAISSSIPRKLVELDVWHGPFGSVRDSLRNAAAVCSRWTLVCSELTGQYWKSYQRNPWTDDPHVDERVSQLGQRIEEVLDLRSQHEQLVRLLSGEEQESLATGAVFAAFDGLQPLHYNPYTEPSWRASANLFWFPPQVPTHLCIRPFIFCAEAEGPCHAHNGAKLTNKPTNNGANKWAKNRKQSYLSG
jgi:dynein heavy chain 2